MSSDFPERFHAICLKLWGPIEGEEVHTWIVENRPPAFQATLIQVMVPIWEMNKVELKTKILCGITLFVALHMQEVDFFMKMAAHHGIPKEQVEEIILLAGLEAGFPKAEGAILTLNRVYEEHTERFGPIS